MIYYYIGVAVCLAAAAFLPRYTVIRGNSMRPAFKNGDWALYLPHRMPRRGDIVICTYPEAWRKERHCRLPLRYIKRVAALPGERIRIEDGQVYVNDCLLQEAWLSEDFNRRKRSFDELQLAEDEFFVMGDNRDVSVDSRRVGPIRRRCILGTVVRSGSNRLTRRLARTRIFRQIR